MPAGGKDELRRLEHLDTSGQWGQSYNNPPSATVTTDLWTNSRAEGLMDRSDQVIIGQNDIMQFKQYQLQRRSKWPFMMTVILSQHTRKKSKYERLSLQGQCVAQNCKVAEHPRPPYKPVFKSNCTHKGQSLTQCKEGGVMVALTISSQATNSVLVEHYQQGLHMDQLLGRWR